MRDALKLTEGTPVRFRVENGDLVLDAVGKTPDLLEEWFGKYPLASGSEDAVQHVRDLRGWTEDEIDL